MVWLDVVLWRSQGSRPALGSRSLPSPSGCPQKGFLITRVVGESVGDCGEGGGEDVGLFHNPRWYSGATSTATYLQLCFSTCQLHLCTCVYRPWAPVPPLDELLKNSDTRISSVIKGKIQLTELCLRWGEGEMRSSKRTVSRSRDSVSDQR